MKKHAGAYLEVYVASELRLGWRVGRIQVCVRVVPACDHVVRMLSTSQSEVRTFRARVPAPGAVAALEEQSTREPQARAAGASCWPL